MYNIYAVLKNVLGHPLAKNCKIETLQRFITWQIASRLLKKSIVHSFANYTKLIINQGQTGLTGNVYNGLSNYEEMAFVMH